MKSLNAIGKEPLDKDELYQELQLIGVNEHGQPEIRTEGKLPNTKLHRPWFHVTVVLCPGTRAPSMFIENSMSNKIWKRTEPVVPIKRRIQPARELHQFLLEAKNRQEFTVNSWILCMRHSMSSRMMKSFF